MTTVLQRLRVGPYREVDASLYPEAFATAVDWPEVEEWYAYRWRHVPGVPVRIFSPSSREDYETDPDLTEEEALRNLERYDMIADGLAMGFVFPPILVDERLAAMHDRDPEATTDVLWAYSRAPAPNPLATKRRMLSW